MSHLPEIHLGRELIEMVSAFWLPLGLAAGVARCAVALRSRQRDHRDRRHRVLPPADLGVVPLLVWAGLVTSTTHDLFSWGHGILNPWHLWHEALAFLRALAAAGGVLTLEALGMVVGARCSLSRERTVLTGRASMLRVVIVGTVFLDGSMLMLPSSAPLLAEAR